MTSVQYNEYIISTEALVLKHQVIHSAKYASIHFQLFMG